MNLIDDLLGRPTAWLGIDEPLKKTKLSEIQSRMDNISHSLVQYSGSGEHEYNSNSQRESNLQKCQCSRGILCSSFLISELLVVKLRVLREVDTDSGHEFSTGGSTIHVATSNGDAGSSSTGSIAFQAFENFGCILDQRNDW